MPIYIKWLVGALFLAYPFIIYFGLMNFALWQIASLISVIAGIRLIALKDIPSQMAKVGFYSSIFLIFLSLLSVVLNQLSWLKFYPIIVNLLALVLFASSLFSEKSTIQRIAEIREKNIDCTKQKYMHKLTIIWCLFFIINASISAYTMLYMSLKEWTLYNGFISYILIGLLLGLELLYRHFIVLRRLK